MKLHVLPPSPNSHGPLAIVNKLKIPAEIVNAYGKTRTPEFIAMNPCHCCPTLEFEDGTSMWESNAVMRYLVVNHDKEHVLYPEDAKLRGRIDMVMDWRQASLYPCLPAIGYIVFGMAQKDEEAQQSFAKLQDEHFKTLTDVFLKDTAFCYSDKPTIADLAIAPCLTFIKVRSKFWEAMPDKVKEYHARVLEAFPETKENFDMLDGMVTSYTGEGKDTEPLEHA